MPSDPSPACVEGLERRLLFAAVALPRPAHVVVLLEEDHSYSQLFGRPVAPLQIWPVNLPNVEFQDPNFRQLERQSASFTNAYSVGNHNLVDYQAIFSGVVPGPRDRPSPAHPYTAPNIASELNAAGLSWAGYAEGLPHMGYTGGGVGDYTDAHNPWILFNNVPATENLPFARFPGNYSKLPTVSYVVPNEQDNMHSGPVQDADDWYQSNIAPYARWAMGHNSLLIVTWDESHQGNDQIPTLFYGPMVRAGHYGERITQANILATLEDMYGLPRTGRSVGATAISDIFKPVKVGRASTRHGAGGATRANVAAGSKTARQVTPADIIPATGANGQGDDRAARHQRGRRRASPLVHLASDSAAARQHIQDVAATFSESRIR